MPGCVWQVRCSAMGKNLRITIPNSAQTVVDVVEQPYGCEGRNLGIQSKSIIGLRQAAPDIICEAKARCKFEGQNSAHIGVVIEMELDANMVTKQVSVWGTVKRQAEIIQGRYHQTIKGC
jgi:hypothetical protein